MQEEVVAVLGQVIMGAKEVGNIIQVLSSFHSEMELITVDMVINVQMVVLSTKDVALKMSVLGMQTLWSFGTSSELSLLLSAALQAI